MSRFAAPFADANRLFRSGLVLVDELACPSPVRPVETMARVLARTRMVRTLSLSRALSLGAGKYALCGALAGGVAVAAGAALGRSRPRSRS